MIERERFRPFTGDTSNSVRLKSAPLELVLCQIRWPDLMHLQGDLKPIALAFGQALGDYPLYREVQELAYTITPEGVQESTAGYVYQWRSLDGFWHVSLGKQFASLYCTRYETFENFSDRLRKVVDHLGSDVGVQLVQRIGVRYINRLTDPRLIENPGDYIHHAVLGYRGLKPSTDGVRLVNSSNQAMYKVEDVSLHVRSGMVPPGETPDPAVPPIQQTSWVLDLDASAEPASIFNPTEILSTAGKLADTAYDFFKLVTTSGFIREFGGES